MKRFRGKICQGQVGGGVFLPSGHRGRLHVISRPSFPSWAPSTVLMLVCGLGRSGDEALSVCMAGGQCLFIGEAGSFVARGLASPLWLKVMVSLWDNKMSISSLELSPLYPLSKLLGSRHFVLTVYRSSVLWTRSF